MIIGRRRCRWKTDISDKNNDDTTRIVGFKILTALLSFLVRDTVSSVQRYQNIITVENSLKIVCFIISKMIVQCGKRRISFARKRYQISIQFLIHRDMDSVFQR